VVKIDDTVAPEIMLNGSEEMTVDVKTLFVDPGFIAIDNYYNNVTRGQDPAQGPNMNKLGTTVITYTACDGSNNCNSIQRIVHVVDRIAPVITLIGANPYTHPRFSPYADPGVILTDNYYTDTDLRPKDFFDEDYSKISNDMPGLYLATFNLTDPSGNKARTVTRLVVVPEESLTGVKETEAGVFNLYPNPSTGKFTIELEEGSGINTVKVYSILGSLVAAQAVNKEKSVGIDLSAEKDGVYIVRMEAEGKSYTRKITLVR
jgi:hypothetical protein